MSVLSQDDQNAVLDELESREAVAAGQLLQYYQEAVRELEDRREWAIEQMSGDAWIALNHFELGECTWRTAVTHARSQRDQDAMLAAYDFWLAREIQRPGADHVKILSKVTKEGLPLVLPIRDMALYQGVVNEELDYEDVFKVLTPRARALLNPLNDFQLFEEYTQNPRRNSPLLKMMSADAQVVVQRVVDGRPYEGVSFGRARRPRVAVRPSDVHPRAAALIAATYDEGARFVLENTDLDLVLDIDDALNVEGRDAKSIRRVANGLAAEYDDVSVDQFKEFEGLVTIVANAGREAQRIESDRAAEVSSLRQQRPDGARDHRTL